MRPKPETNAGSACACCIRCEIWCVSSFGSSLSRHGTVNQQSHKNAGFGRWPGKSRSVSDRGDRAMDTFPVESLPRMYGEEKRHAVFSAATELYCTTPDTLDQTYTLSFDEERGIAKIADVAEIPKGETVKLLRELATVHLEAAGNGLDPLDYPTVPAPDLSKRMRLGSGEALRRRVNRARNTLGRLFEAAGLDADQGKDLIENIPWQGYRLNPTLVIVRVKSTTR